MASPQKENGYTAIANEIMEALASIRIPGEARQVLDVILRKTYGWNKKEDKISLSQFRKITSLKDHHIIRSRKKLISMNLITTKKGNRGSVIYGFQKDYTKWRPLPKRTSTTKKGNRHYLKRESALSKKVDTKDTITKPSITKAKEVVSFDFDKRKFLNITIEDKAGWLDAYPACDIDQELRKMREWLLANPEKRKKNYRRFIVNWLVKAQDKGGTKLSYDEQRKKKLDDWEKKPIED